MKAPTIGIVVPCYNEYAILPKTIAQISSCAEELIAMGNISDKSFILFVDDGSYDKTWELISENVEGSNLIQGLKLSRNFGHQNALLAGLLACGDKVDCTISIDADLQQDINAIPDFLSEYNKGADIVFGIRNDRQSDSIIKRVTAEFFYSLMKNMGVDIIRNHADYRLMSNKAINVLAEYEEGNLFLRGIVPTIGFKQSTVYFDVKDRELGESKYTLLRMLAFAASGITSFSITPLRLVTAIGFVFTFLSLIMLLYVLTAKVFFDNAVPGWASVVVPIYLLGGIQLLSIGIIGEYVGRIYMESKRRPRFVVEENSLD